MKEPAGSSRVAELLGSIGAEHDESLAAALLDISALGDRPVPAPSPALAALMTGEAGRTPEFGELAVPDLHADPVRSAAPATHATRRSARRGLRRRGRVFVTTAIIAILCAGGSAAAVASPELRDGARHAIDGLVHTLVPRSALRPAPATPTPRPTASEAPPTGGPATGDRGSAASGSSTSDVTPPPPPGVRRLSGLVPPLPHLPLLPALPVPEPTPGSGPGLVPSVPTAVPAPTIP